MTERQKPAHDRPRFTSTDTRSVAARDASRNDRTSSRPAQDPLAALERARRVAFEAQEAERWDGLA